MTTTRNGLKVLGFLVSTMILGFIYRAATNKSTVPYILSYISDPIIYTSMNPENILKEGNGIIFLETTDRMEPPSLVLCAIESAARVYPDRPVVFFMKGLTDINSEDDEKRAKERFPSLSSFENVYIFPLRMEKLFNNTPLLMWYLKADPKRERYWIHNLSDGCRMAMMWRYGGFYFDADVISMRPIPEKNFLTAENQHTSGSSVFGLSPHNSFAWTSLNDFVQNYNGDAWGNQGPTLFTRVLKQSCELSAFKSLDNIVCGNISFLHPERIYPIPYGGWKRYFEVWDKIPTFDNSYALHLWNYMNSGEKKTVVIGSNTLVENLYKQYCPSIYGLLAKNATTANQHT
ncbi:hypothetical protein XENTR_v10014866 [Xenopus tropicalis]|uniref:Alpha-1,4-N-acetylglucosaminyltransferase n=3 Tax=Xenopus tropicalis TaxID=8364 RepID=A0A803JVQ8_XENTR|nr:alpha-1,4-N-acetylglucosaminyltransferase [Xenopus tropicalis]XP_012809603.1 alpha-1,4-N-acetylglucosaminyltransferase [Xenopus tropicalis]XP_031758509.1 alpha-1,4-N-acetylglucosaminyltransferase [Xenopus tropicalis]XP_031758510.1 alpha-1,4-N-acetylglucosaminyltransferase [Xenopus tropicalis]KAE8604868.1 hypothetical protein XENTR_v10014866 [Xenopus tropicalis]|eukprot:XP_002935110.1 PREDICTED: alpha-1,4-N-acetylglucosaminyltransferase-like [Xenopus tropicalis]